MTEPEAAPVATKRTVERIRRDRRVQAACALDSVPLLASRVTDMLWWGRRMSVVRRWIGVENPIELLTGLTVNREIGDRAVRLTVEKHGYTHFGVNLSPGLNGFSFEADAYARSDYDTEEQVWTRWHAGDRRDITIVELTGGGPSDGGPGQDDCIRIRNWSRFDRDGVGRETVIGFDTGHYFDVWHEREKAAMLMELQLGLQGGGQDPAGRCGQFAQVGPYRVRCAWPLDGDGACEAADDHVEGSESL